MSKPIWKHCWQTIRSSSVNLLYGGHFPRHRYFFGQVGFLSFAVLKSQVEIKIAGSRASKENSGYRWGIDRLVCGIDVASGVQPESGHCGFRGPEAPTLFRRGRRPCQFRRQSTTRFKKRTSINETINKITRRNLQEFYWLYCIGGVLKLKIVTQSAFYFWRNLIRFR